MKCFYRMVVFKVETFWCLSVTSTTPNAKEKLYAMLGIPTSAGVQARPVKERLLFLPPFPLSFRLLHVSMRISEEFEREQMGSLKFN